MRLLKLLALALTLLLATCSLRSFRPELTVRVSLNPNTPGPIALVNPLLTEMSCFLVVFHGNGIDDFSDSDTAPRSHVCTRLYGRSSTLVSLNSLKAGIKMSVPLGNYSAEVIGLRTSSDCAGKSVRTVFQAGVPEIFSIALRAEAPVTSGAFIPLTSTYDSNTATDFGVTCNVPPATFVSVDGNGVGGINRSVLDPATLPQLTSFNSKLYATWIEYTTPYTVRAAVYNGNDASPGWSFIDGGGSAGLNYDTGRSAYASQLTVYNSKLYLAFQQNNATSDQIRVLVYNGNDSAPAWSYVDGGTVDGINFSTSAMATRPQLVVLGPDLYATWTEINGGVNQVRLAAYNGNDSAPTWSFRDGGTATGLNKNSTRIANNPEATVFNSKLYLTWAETDGIADQIRVKVYNGGGFTFVDGDLATGLNLSISDTASTPQLTVFDSKLFLIWSEVAGVALRIHVAVYNGNDSSPTWSFVDVGALNRDAGQVAYGAQLTVLGSRLYATWAEDNGSAFQIRVAEFNGTVSTPAWNFIGDTFNNGLNHNPVTAAYQPQLTVFDSKLYLAWYELYNGNGQIRVSVGQ